MVAAMKNPKLIRNWILFFVMMAPLIVALVYPHTFGVIVGAMSIVITFLPVKKLK